MIELTIFLFGLIIGSFLNVVIYRYNTGRTLSGRSGCLSCGHKLQWYELIPLISFVWQKGRCRHCRSRLSWQYPLVELGTGLLFALIYQRVGLQFNLLALYGVIACTLMVILVYDWRHKIVPNPFVYLFILAGFIQPLMYWDASLLVRLGWTMLGGAVTTAPLLILWLVSRGRWLGFGDVKLALGIGLLLGINGGLSALILAFFFGAVIGLLLIGWGKLRLWRRSKSYTMKSEIPFAPFLILGFWLVFFFSINVLVF